MNRIDPSGPALGALLLLLVVCVFIQPAPPAAHAASSTPAFKVVTTIPPIHCFTLNVAGTFATVESLIPSGGSAHDFQFTTRERRRLEAASLVVINGLGIESWLTKTLKQIGHKPMVEATAGFSAELIDANPHAWLDPILATRMVTNILQGLSAADPANAAGYASNATVFVAKLHQLDADIRAGLAGITNRAMVTAHEAFPYFARRYDLRVVGILEEVADVDPGAGHLSELRRRIEREGVQAMFLDSHHSGRRARQMARDFKVRVGILDTLEASPLTPTAYENGMRANLGVLQQTLK